MRKLLCFLLFALPTFGQGNIPNTVTINYNGIPYGSCTQTEFANNIQTGDFYNCKNRAWNKVSGGGGGSGTVISVGFTGGIISVANPTTTPAFTVAGTSGGIPCFTSSSVWASSGDLTANSLVNGGGAGVCPSPSLFTDNGTTGAYSGTGGFNASAGPLTSGTEPSGAAGSGLFACTEAASGATPTAGTDYFQCNSTTHQIMYSPNGLGPFNLYYGTPAFTAQTDAATVTWAIASALVANASLTFTVHSGSRTLNLTGLVAGGNYVLWLKQDATGGEGLTLGTGCTWKVSGGGSGAITPSTGANAIDVLAFTYDGTNCYANFNKNFN